MNILKNTIKQYYAIFACSENDVYYLLGNKSTSKWINSSEIEDCRNMIIFESRPNVKDYRKEIPDGCHSIEILKIVPTYNETDGYWYEEVDHKRVAV